MPGRLYSTGFSAVKIFMSGVLMEFSAAYSVVDFPDPVGPPQSTPVFAEQFHQPASESMMESPVATAHAGAEVISLDSMRNAMVANFEQDDLDVPAFLRKRGEVM